MTRGKLLNLTLLQFLHLENGHNNKYLPQRVEVNVVRGKCIKHLNQYLVHNKHSTNTGYHLLAKVSVPGVLSPDCKNNTPFDLSLLTFTKDYPDENLKEEIFSSVSLSFPLLPSPISPCFKEDRK